MGITKSTADKKQPASKENLRQNETIRIQKAPSNFVTLHKGFIEDARLSYKAKGILSYLLSKPDNWTVIVKDLMNHSTDGSKSIYAGLNELKKYGYFKKVPVRDESNRFISHWESVIYECPIDEQIVNSESPTLEKDEISPISPLLSPFVYVDNVQEQNVYIQNGQHNNNYNSNNESINNEVISIYPSEIIDEAIEQLSSLYVTASPSIDMIDNTTDKIYTREEVADKISLEELKSSFENEHEEINMLYNCVCEVLTVNKPPTSTIRISRQNIPFGSVKNVFNVLERVHFEYVLDCLNNNDNKYNINRNAKSYFMTSLYNAPRTVLDYYKQVFEKPPQEKSDIDNFLEKSIRKSLKF